MIGWETKNKYTILNEHGQKVYHAYEESDSFERQCCGSGRGFTINIVDNNQQTVIRLQRETNMCDECGGSSLSVEAPPGNLGTLVPHSHSLITNV